MSWKVRFLAGTGLMIFFLIAATYQLTWWHELVHKKIFEEYGLDAEIQISPFGGGETIARGNITREDYKEMRQFHLLTEIVGYHIFGAVFFLTFIMFVAMVLIAMVVGQHGA